jgi:hypothetical protein
MVKIEKQKLEKLLKTQTPQEIANNTGSSRSAIYRLMQKYGIIGYNPRERQANKIIGQKFGKLYVESNTLNKHGRYITFHCLCDCGNKKDISYENLIICKIDHCGCETKLKQRTTRQKGSNVCRDLLSKCKRSAARRNISFNLTIEDLWEVFLKQDKKCALSGVSIEFNSRRNNKQYTIGNASIDRIDGTKGYTKDNIQIVDQKINYAKGQNSDVDFISMCCRVADYQRSLT